MINDNPIIIPEDHKTNIDKYGNLNLNGLNIHIAGAVGDVIVAEFMKTITAEEKDAIISKLKEEVFETRHVYDSNNNPIDKVFFKTEQKVQSGSSCWSRTETIETPVYKIAQDKIREVMSDEIIKQVKEITETDEFLERCNGIANEIIDSAIDNWKESLKKRVYERLVGNVLDGMPHYDNISLRTIINEEIDNRVKY